MDKLISIIVPVYNAEEYLNRCIESVLNQTYKNIEVILVNDGSKDNSLEICNYFAKKDRRIIVIDRENSGTVAARKQAIQIASGEYIGFVDSDDWIELHMFEALNSYMQKYNVDIVSSGTIFEYKDYSYKSTKDKHGLFVINRESDCGENNIFNSYADLLSNVYGTCWNKLYKSELVKKFYSSIPEKIVYPEDVAFTFLCIVSCKSIYIINDAYYHYNQINESSVCKKIKYEESYLSDLTRVYNYLYFNFEGHNSHDELIGFLNKWYLNNLINLTPVSLSKLINKYYFPINKLKKYKRIFIYGAGEVGKSYCAYFNKQSDIEVVGIVDKNKAGIILGDMTVKEVNSLKSAEFDVIVIAIAYKSIARKITYELSSKYNISEDKIIWEKPLTIADELLM